MFAQDPEFRKGESMFAQDSEFRKGESMFAYVVYSLEGLGEEGRDHV